MEYSAGSVKYLLWYVETKDTAKLLQNNSFDEIKTMAIEENLYQQNSADRRKSEYGCIRRRLEAIPEDLIQKLIKADIQTAKIITFIACMMTDRLLFELMYEVYRNKVHYGEKSITDADLNIFMQNKREQSEKVAKWTDVSVNKLKQTYALLVHRLLGISKKLFIQPYAIDMVWYNVQVITSITSSLFRQGMKEEKSLEEILVWLEKNNPDANYGKLIINNEPLKLTRIQLEVISRHRKVASAFLQRTCDLIQLKKLPQISFAEDCQEDKTELKDTIMELVDSIDLDPSFETYLKLIKYKLYVLEDASADFVLAGLDGIVLSGKNTLSSFAKLSLPFDPRKTFSATLQIRQASEQLNDVDETISNDEYLKLLRGVRISLKSAFGPKMYNSYIRIIRDAGTDKSRFLNELLQNADDCLYTLTKSAPRFVLTMRGDILQATYNEDGFTKDNVRALTAMGESTKKLLLLSIFQSER